MTFTITTKSGSIYSGVVFLELVNEGWDLRFKDSRGLLVYLDAKGIASIELK